MRLAPQTITDTRQRREAVEANTRQLSTTVDRLSRLADRYDAADRALAEVHVVRKP